MDIFIYFIPITIIIASIILITLLWNIKNDQYQDLKYQGYNILFIDERNNNK